MSEATQITEMQGSCHCGAVQYKIKDFDLSKVTRCNCTVCVKDGSAMTRVPGDSLLLKAADCSYEAFTYKDNLEDRTSKLRNPNLGMYRFTPNPSPDFVLFRHFCTNCGIPLFVTAFARAMGGSLASVNVNSLDWKAAGLDFKDYTRPERLGYIDGLGDFTTRQGEPWPHGSW